MFIDLFRLIIESLKDFKTPEELTVYRFTMVAATPDGVTHNS